MDFLEFEKLMHASFLANGIAPLNEDDTRHFYNLTNFLLETNKLTNLTALKDVGEIICKHYIDSLFAAPLLPLNARILDIGCGAGFPSLPLAILRSDLDILPLDSTAKKIDFVQKCVELLGLNNVRPTVGRAEDLSIARDNGFFDCVVSRAVARLNVLCELAMPSLRLGGKLVALKGSKADEEIEEAENAIRLLGGEITAKTERTLVVGNETQTRVLIEISKMKPTPSKYPRAFSMISKRPL